MCFATALFAYLTDRIFGEFHFIRHPVVLMGDYIKWFERRFYANTIIKGIILSLTLIIIVGMLGYTVQSLLLPTSSHLAILFLGMLASTTITSKMLYDSVKEIIVHPQKIAYLVSRDTQSLSPSDINKAAVETYAENLSDGVIAPLFYLLLFGLPGAFVYKAINTLDSMVGYRNERYEKFGKFAAKLDDVANYIPARITAVLIVLLTPKRADMESASTSSPKGSTHGSTPTSNKSVAKQRIPKSFIIHHSLFTKVFRNGKRHESPNAGYPISAIAYALGIKLGGPTSYFGKIVPKAYFGKGRAEITMEDIENALKLQPRLDIVILLFLSLGVLL